MATFAKIENNIVTDLIEIDDSKAEKGEQFINSLGIDGTWVRARATDRPEDNAFIGGDYDPETGKFYPPKPFSKWVWNEEIYNFQPPTAMPDDEFTYEWNDELEEWKKVQ